MTALVRVLFAGAALSLAAIPAVQAQDCSAAPAFVSVSTANANVRASASLIERSDWATAEHFARSAINSGTTSRNKAAAAVNLCAALANQAAKARRMPATTPPSARADRGKPTPIAARPCGWPAIRRARARTLPAPVNWRAARPPCRPIWPWPPAPTNAG